MATMESSKSEEQFSKKWELQFNSVEYKVKINKKVPFTAPPNPSELVILNNLSGYIRTGEVTAIMGPSGAGKTSLLDILANRLHSKSYSGLITINGLDRHTLNTKHYRTSSYVMQDDALYPILTVRETIQYSAKLRLPHLTKEQIEDRVDRVIDELGLTHVANSKVGNQSIRGVSGGERRRVSIGIELVTEPHILFMDEPTSGLDSNTALEVVQLIHSLARRGRAIVVSIHQPSKEIYALLDRIYFLSKGNIVMAASGSLADEFWAQDEEGPLPKKRNPSDVIMERVVRYEREGRVQELVDRWNNFYEEKIRSSVAAEATKPSKKGSKTGSSRKLKRTDLKEIDDPTPLYKDVSRVMSKAPSRFFAQGGSTSSEQELNSATEEEREKVIQFFREKRARKASYATQIWVLGRIQLIRTFRTKDLFIKRCVLYLLMSVLLGSIFFDVEGKTVEEVEEWLSFLVFSTALMYFPAMGDIPIHMENRNVFLREYSNGYYSVWSYVFAQFTTYIPVAAILGLAFSLFGYWMVGLQTNFSVWIVYWLISFVSVMASEAIVVVVAAITDEALLANSIGTAMFAFMFLFSGFFITVDEIPDYWIWFHYLSLFKYALQAHIQNQLTDDVGPFQCAQSVLSQPGLSNCTITADEMVDDLNMNDIGLFESILVLAGYVVFYKAIWVLILVMKGTKRK